MTDDLWGEIPDVASIKTPHSVLLEQANLLTEKTKGLLVGGVRRSANNDTFHNTLTITAPSLNNYIYGVCSVQHSISLYPLVFIGYGHQPNVGMQFNDESSFISRLRKELSAPQTTRVVTGLLAQIHADKVEKH